jgi:glycosyltransferase involved in cell wall biosynthesis
MKLMLFISDLRPGGAERVMATLANAFAEAGHEVVLTSIGRADGDFYEIDPRVARIGLGMKRSSKGPLEALYRNARRIAAIRAAVRRTSPDAIVAFTCRVNVSVLLATIGLRTPVVVSERIDPAKTEDGALWRAMRPATYRWAAAIVAQTERERRWFRRRGMAASIIPNPLRADALESALPDASRRERIVMAMGRHVRQKGFDLLIDAFASFSKSRSGWRLEIFGEGPEGESLARQAEEAGVGALVSFPGVTKDPLAAMRRCSIFVLSSRFEGFPNVLVEAMSQGAACAAFDCPNGPREILRDGVDGRLVALEDIAGLAAALEQLAVDEGLRAALGSEAAKAARGRFSIKAIQALWEEELRRALRRPERSRREGRS